MTTIPTLEDQILSSTLQLDSWIDANGWTGWDPYDIQCSYFLHRFVNKSRIIKVIHSRLFKFWNRYSPKFIRKFLRVKPQINPKGMGVLTHAYCNLYYYTRDEKYLEKAKKTAEWLLTNSNPEYENLCWGYPFDWQSRIFIPKGTPLGIIGTSVGPGFWELYQITKDKKYLEACKSICQFIINDLNQTRTDKGLCFSYSTLDNYQVLNANLFNAEFLIRIGNEIKNKEWLSIGKEALFFTIAEQNSDGSFCYWSKEFQEQLNIPCTNDHYHTGFKIRLLHQIWSNTKDAAVKESLDALHSHYINNYFAVDNAPLLSPKNYIVDMHGCAEALICNSILSKDFPKAKQIVRNTSQWIIENEIQKPQGWFVYQLLKPKNRTITIDIPYLRWCQSWMLLGLSFALLDEKN